MLDIYLVQQIINGLSIGLVYALMAIGFTLIFGVLNVVNFAHGEVYMIGAFAGLMLITSAPLRFSSSSCSCWWSARRRASGWNAWRSSRSGGSATKPRCVRAPCARRPCCRRWRCRSSPAR